MMKTKICSKCRIEKELSEFHKHRTSKDGRKSVCKICRSRKSALNLKREILEKEHKKICGCCYKIKLFSEFHKQKSRKNGIGPYCKKCIAKLAIKNKDRINKYHRYWNKKNKDKKKANNLKWLKSNPSYYKKYNKNRKAIDIKYRIRCGLATRIVSALNGYNKSLNTMFLIGCEIDYLMYYLQNKFKEGMSWDNYGTGKNGKGMKEWHVDHIIPCCKFDLRKKSEQKKCFHYTNLQPLWAKENYNKISEDRKN